MQGVFLPARVVSSAKPTSLQTQHPATMLHARSLTIAFCVVFLGLAFTATARNMLQEVSRRAHPREQRQAAWPRFSAAGPLALVPTPHNRQPLGLSVLRLLCLQDPASWADPSGTPQEASRRTLTATCNQRQTAPRR
jgi:hypothetical protein